MSKPSLSNIQQVLRPYQRELVDDAAEFVDRARELPAESEPAKRRILYSMPTGTGKGTAELVLLDELRNPQTAAEQAPDVKPLDAWILTPSLEVLRGYLERCGAGDVSTASESKLAELGEAIFVTTPTRMQNRVMKGERGMPEVIVYDEVHHAIEGADVAGTLFALAPLSVWVGFTATPFRGTPEGTKALEDAWPEQVTVLTIPEAVELGAWALPTFEVVGLVDDDQVTVTKGDFQVKATGALVGSRITAVADLVQQKLTADALRDRRTGGVALLPGWKPTAVTVPSRETAGLLVEALDAKIPGVAYLIDQSTPAAERQKAYDRCARGDGVLVSVRVLAEGVDMPWLRRLIDARPTLSPVSWLQQVGRITRPGLERPEYICVCRNLERHAYLLQGMVPRRKVFEAQKAFPKPSKRAAARSVALEALNRFKPIELPLLEGVTGTMYALYDTDPNTGATTEWVTLLDPTSERAISARRVNQPAGPDGQRGYGTWAAAPLPDKLSGFATSQFRGEISTADPKCKRAAWWARAAGTYGLDPDAVRPPNKLAARQFQALPVLKELKLSMRAQPTTDPNPNGDL